MYIQEFSGVQPWAFAFCEVLMMKAECETEAADAHA